MELVVSVDNMRKSDSSTIAKYNNSKQLMYKAALGISKHIPQEGKTLIICGSGNNGGDGYALASILADKNRLCEILIVKNKFSDDGLFYFNLAKQKDIPYSFYNSNFSFNGFDIIVDCILGTGFKGDVTGITKDIIEAINNSNSFVISADINSGLNGDTGLSNFAVKSDITVSIGTIKIGHLINDAYKFIGKLVNEDIGIEIIEKPYYLINNEEKLNLLSTNTPIIYSYYSAKETFECTDEDFIQVLSQYCQIKNISIVVKGNTDILFVNDNVYLCLL